MKNTEDILIELLSAFVNDEELKDMPDYDSEKLYNLALAQAVTGIVGYELSKNNMLNKEEPDEKLSIAFDKTVSQFIRKEFYALNLLRELNKAEIPHIIFKGLVVKDFYPVAELRTYSDVDIIIRAEDREKSHNLMLSMGFDYVLMDGGDVYSYKRDREHYEIHTTLNSERTKLSEYMSNYWSYTKKRDGFTYEFEREFHFCYLISHIEKHVYGSGAGIRMYMDIAILLNKFKDSLDFNKVRTILEECGLSRFYNTVLYLCNRWFKTDVLPEKTLYEELYQKFFEITMSGGAFGNQEKDATVDDEVRRVVDDNGKVNKFVVLLNHVFPPYREVRRMYPAFNNKPFLLPVAWCVHFFKAGKRSGLKNLKRIVSADVDSAKKEKELLEKIGSGR